MKPQFLFLLISTIAHPARGGVQSRLINSLAHKEKKSINAATHEWMKTVCAEGDTSEATTLLYAPDAILWGSMSEDVRVERRDIKSYFEFFAAIPGLRVKSGSFRSVTQAFGDGMAQSTGYYTFQYPNVSQG